MRLDSGWMLASSEPGRIAGPDGIGALDGAWREARVPGTVAASLGLGPQAPEDIESRDWWYRCRFAGPPDAARRRLRFDGLATIAEAWLNGEPLLSSRNMFVERSVEVSGRLRDTNEVLICFRSLRPELAARRPRPRWKTALVEQQNLRWIRTTLLGRIPGWTPPLPPIGPWRAARLEPMPVLRELDLRCGLDGDTGRLSVSATVDLPGPIDSATVVLGERGLPLEVRGTSIRGDHPLPGVAPWWPHTHGEPALHDCTIVIRAGGAEHRVPCGRVGFRSVRWSHEDGRWTVNGRTVFVRGACWTGEGMSVEDPEDLERSLARARDAGANMLRVAGPTAYGSDLFYERCDALGLLVWQDFMFANMDYPFADPAFAAEVEEEVASVLARLRAHPCIAAYCGGSEIQQQAAMMGLPAAERAIPFLEETLPALCERHHGGVPYVPGTPYGGAQPFHTRSGITHYYGVGAYLRPLEDARRAGVRFTAECLGFSNVPDAAHVEAMLEHGLPVPHLPAWKAGVPRDNGAGWDFEDVRDHYLRRLFGHDPIALRSTDPGRYLELSRIVSGEAMLRTFAEWRRPGSGCGGALVWFWRDLRPGAGWGVLDADGRPKAAWWFLRRAWARRAVLITDEGLDGLDLHVINEHDAPLDAIVELESFKGAARRAGFARAALRLEPHSSATLSGEAMLDAFADLAYAYRFGPPRHDVVVARLRDAQGTLLHEDAWFPAGHALPTHGASCLQASARAGDDGSVELQLSSDAFLQAVTVGCAGHDPSDDVFHLSPGVPRTLRMTPRSPSKPFKAMLTASNLDGSVTVRA